MLLSSAAHAVEHDPVIMIPGMTGWPSLMDPMRNHLQQRGWRADRLFTWTDADRMNTDMEASARNISAKVDEVLRQTGAQKVVLATWSASTIAGRFYIKNLGGDKKVSQFISFAGPHHGIDKWQMCFANPACKNQWGPIPNTPWLKALNSGTEVPGWPAVRYLTIRGSADWQAAPVETAMLAGADENFLVQGANHNTVITDTRALEKMRTFILEHEKPAGPLVTACAATVSGTNATVTATGDQTNGAIVSYRVQLSGPTGTDDVASVAGASFSKTYALSDGYYTGSVTATDNQGRVSPPCSIPRFKVGTPSTPVGNDPIIFMTGASGDITKIRPLKDYLQTQGWEAARLFEFVDSSKFQGDVPTTAREISAKVDDVLRTTGASKVVLVGFSSSAVSSRYYIKNLGGTQKVSQFVSIAGPHHGISRYLACQWLWVSCAQWGPIPNTPFLNELNSGTEVPGSPHVKYLTLRGSADINAHPVDTAMLAGADENAYFQGLDHYTLITNPAAQAKVRDFLRAHGGGTEPPLAGAPTGLGVSGFTSNSVSLAWTGVANVSGYNVYQATSGGPWTRANGSVVSGTSFNVTGLTAGTTYYFVVRAQKADGTESANSNQVSQNTGGSGGGTTPSEQVSAPVYTHFIAGRVSVNDYLTLGARHGYLTSITLYRCGSSWTDKADCSPI